MFDFLDLRRRNYAETCYDNVFAHIKAQNPTAKVQTNFELQKLSFAVQNS